MAAIALSGGSGTVFSRTGTGKRCNFPVQTSTGAASVSTVLVGGIPPVVFGDTVGFHLAGGCGPDLSTLSSGSSTVFIGGKRVGRIGDQYGSDNVITSGFGTVFIGG